MKISREDVLRVAELAHLGLSPEEIDAYRDKLDSILSYMDKLKELDITDVEPMAQVIYRARNARRRIEPPGAPRRYRAALRRLRPDSCRRARCRQAFLSRPQGD